ncbi:zinc finger protein [Trichonephila inaurata madagascariensis]|uniref:Zinc finger protein n=1 Tax=Trichonephila inaurata madagascariensis TaxID=2747483 RepID=A0A8X6Y2T9_9ARAC|nr:zinc finger protein [Trichonephila inaurata madagascariensis]
MFVVNATKIENGPTQLTVVPHVCSICKKAFLQHKTLEEHFKTHLDGERETKADASSCPNDEKEVLKTANKLHTCGICDRSFSSKTYLQKHVALHGGDRPHECTICRKTFALKDNLQKHYRIHDPMKQRFFCSECGALEQHYLVHSGERPFSCNLCSRSFKQKSHRDKHLQTHIGQDLSNTNSSNSNELGLPSDTSVKEWIDDGVEIKIENADE